MKIRGKFQLQSVKETHWGGGQKELQFAAVYDPSIPEDHKYAEATPSGGAQMLVKKDVAERFTLGEFYYVDFTPVSPPAPTDPAITPITEEQFAAARGEAPAQDASGLDLVDHR